TFLELVPGPQTTNNLFSMVNEALRLELAAAFRQVATTGGEVIHSNVSFESSGEVRLVDVRVRKVEQPEQFRGLFLTTFEHLRSAAEPEQERAAQLTRPLDRAAEL